MKKVFIICFILVVCVFRGNAQSTSSANVKDSTNRGLWGFFGVYNSPTQDFANAGYNSGGGMGLEFYSPKLIANKTSPINMRLGLSMFYSGQGSTTNSVLLHDPYKAPGQQTIHNNLSGMDLRLRIIAENENNIINPYMDLFCGMRAFSSKQTLSINQQVYGYQSSTKSLIDYNIAPVLGTSFGMLIKMSPHTFLDLKASYAATTQPVGFVDFNHMHNDGFMYDSGGHNATASMWSYQVGLIFKPKPRSPMTYSSYSAGYSYHPTYNSYHSYHSSYHSSYHGSCGHSGGGRALR